RFYVQNLDESLGIRRSRPEPAIQVSGHLRSFARHPLLSHRHSPVGWPLAVGPRLCPVLAGPAAAACQLPQARIPNTSDTLCSVNGAKRGELYPFRRRVRSAVSAFLELFRACQQRRDAGQETSGGSTVQHTVIEA